MTEKRFEIMDGIDKDRYTGIWDEHGKNDELCVSEVVNLLNFLNDENKQLQHKLSQQEMEYATTAYRHAEENEELKQEYICRKELTYSENLNEVLK